MERTLQQLFQQGNIAIFLNIFFVIDHVFNDIIGDLLIILLRIGKVAVRTGRLNIKTAYLIGNHRFLVFFADDVTIRCVEFVGRLGASHHGIPVVLDVYPTRWRYILNVKEPQHGRNHGLIEFGLGAIEHVPRLMDLLFLPIVVKSLDFIQQGHIVARKVDELVFFVVIKVVERLSRNELLLVNVFA